MQDNRELACHCGDRPTQPAPLCDGYSPGLQSGPEGWHRIFAVNQTSVFLGTKLAAEQMAKTGGGSIVNISSIMGFIGGSSGHPAYSASKGAGRIYTKSAAVRYGPLGGRV